MTQFPEGDFNESFKFRSNCTLASPVADTESKLVSQRTHLASDADFEEHSTVLRIAILFFFVCFAKLISHGIKQAKTKTETSICQKRENQAARRVTCDVCCVWLWVVFSFNYVARRVTSIFLCVSSTAFKALRFISIMTLSRGHKAGGQIKSLSPLQLLLIDQRQHFSLAFHFTLYCLSQRVSTCSMWEGTTEEKKSLHSQSVDAKCENVTRDARFLRCTRTFYAGSIDTGCCWRHCVASISLSTRNHQQVAEHQYRLYIFWN